MTAQNKAYVQELNGEVSKRYEIVQKIMDVGTPEQKVQGASSVMRGKIDADILAERNLAIARAKETTGDDVEVLETFFQNAPVDAKPLWFLGKSLEFLADADVAYFAPGWEAARGCKIEHQSAVDYGIQVIEVQSHGITPSF